MAQSTTKRIGKWPYPESTRSTVKMQIRIALPTILCLALTAVPAWTQWSYDNGPINGTTDAWTINFGFTASDTFTAGGTTVSGFNFGFWEFPGDVLSSLDWSVTTGENSGTTLGAGTASGQNLTDTFISTNQYGYDIDKISVTASVSGLTSGSTYWLNLQTASTPSGDPVYWDENSGVGCGGSGCPSKASESAVGTIPSEAFTMNGGTGTTPEPSSILLFGSGILGLAGVPRRRPWKSY
jgi:PEP-CTERM motif